MDEQLIRQAQTGDLPAYELLIRKHQETIFNLAFRFTNNKDDASDLAQDVLIKVFHALPKFRMQSDFTTWIYRITYNTFLDQRKKSSFRQKSAEIPLEDTSNLQDGYNPLKDIEKQHLAAQVQDALNKLPPKMRIIINLFHFQNMSYEEISRVLQASAGTVMSRLNRARNKLRKILVKSGNI